MSFFHALAWSVIIIFVVAVLAFAATIGSGIVLFFWEVAKGIFSVFTM